MRRQYKKKGVSILLISIILMSPIENVYAVVGSIKDSSTIEQYSESTQENTVASTSEISDETVESTNETTEKSEETTSESSKETSDLIGDKNSYSSEESKEQTHISKEENSEGVSEKSLNEEKDRGYKAETTGPNYPQRAYSDPIFAGSPDLKNWPVKFPVSGSTYLTRLILESLINENIKQQSATIPWKAGDTTRIILNRTTNEQNGIAIGGNGAGGWKDGYYRGNGEKTAFISTVGNDIYSSLLTYNGDKQDYLPMSQEDFPFRYDIWKQDKILYAFNSDSYKYTDGDGHASLTLTMKNPGLSNPGTPPSMTVTDADGQRLQLTFYESNGSNFLDIKRIDTNINPTNKSNQTLFGPYIGYGYNYNAITTNIVGGWTATGGEDNVGIYQPVMKIPSSAPPALSFQSKTPIKIKVNEKLTPEMISNALIVSNKVDGSTITYAPGETSFDTPGEKSVKVKVTETLNGISRTSEITIGVNVYSGLEATAINQEINLGTSLDEFKKKKLVKDVEFDSKILDESEYTVSLITEPDLATVGDKTAKVKIAYGNESLEINVPVKVDWGNTVLLKGTGYKSVLGLSIQPDTDTPSLVPVKGTASSGVIHEASGQYISFTVYDDSGTELYKETLDNSLKVDTLYQNIKKVKFESGYVLKVSHEQVRSHPKVVNIYNDSTETTPNEDNHMVNNDLFLINKNNKFEVMNFNQLVPKDATVPIGTSKDYLDEHIKDFIDTKDYSGIELEFTEYPDTNKEGSQEGKIIAKEQTKSGSFMKETYKVNFDVVNNQKITAEATPQNVPLGSDSSSLILENLVNNVKINGELVEKDAYTIEIVDFPSTDTNNSPTVTKVKVINKAFPSETVTVDIPTQILWGNSVVFGSYDYGGNGRTSATFTLHTFDKPIITASQGKNDDDLEIHSSFPNDLYYSFNLFDMKDKEAQLIDENQLGDKYIQANGGDPKKTKLNDWGSGVNRQQAVNYGDVVRAWQVETSKNWLYENEEMKTYNNKKQAVYYEITKKGYKPLQINFATTKKQKISIDMTDEEINNQISQSIDLPAGLDAKFIEYPSRDKAGDANGVIRVSQVLESGKKVEYDYTVPFEIVNDRLIVETKNSDIPLGTKNENIKVNDFISNVKLGDTVLAEDKYDAEIIEYPYTGVLGKQNIKIKVSLVDNESKIIETSTDANIVWGNTIAVLDQDDQYINASVSLLNDASGNPYIVANEGSGFAANSQLSVRPNYLVFRDSDSSDNKVLELGEGTINRHPRDLMNEWNEVINSQEDTLKYGDVARIHVRKWSTAQSIYNGEKTNVSRNEKLVKETVGYQYAYYELTKDGYRLMHVNQMTVKNDVKVALGTNKEEMNKNIHDFLSIPSHITNSEDYRMEFDSVDTDTAGKKTSYIDVYEKLQTGGEFKTTYQINYTVNPRVEESSFDEDGQSLSEMKQTDFDFGTKFTPNPAKYLTKDNDLYVYKGWLSDGEVPGTDTPNEGSPSATETTKKYYYIYEKADKYINVTIPTEMVFGTYENTEKVTSKSYQLKNNSNEFTTKVTLDKFEKVKSDVNLLGESEDEPTSSEKSAKLSLLVEGKPLINGLNESVENKEIVDLMPASTANLSIDGKYFGDKKEKNIVEYNTKLKFKSIEGNK